MTNRRSNFNKKNNFTVVNEVGKKILGKRLVGWTRISPPHESKCSAASNILKATIYKHDPIIVQEFKFEVSCFMDVMTRVCIKRKT